MQAPYIPAKDADFALWLENFATLIAAAPTTYGLASGDATVISAANTAFQAAFLDATNPTTRTSATIAEKDAQRASATSTVRPYAVAVSRNSGVLDVDKVAVGVNLFPVGRTPVPPPITQPVLNLVQGTPGVLTLGYADASTPASKAKPVGVTGLQIFVSLGTAPVSDPALATFREVATKSPVQLGFSGPDAGKVASIFGRWVTRSGAGGVASVGPWSSPLAAVVM